MFEPLKFDCIIITIIIIIIIDAIIIIIVAIIIVIIIIIIIVSIIIIIIISLNTRNHTFGHVRSMKIQNACAFAQSDQKPHLVLFE